MGAVDTQMRIDKVAIVGAGNMGSGIAQKIATEGYPVVLIDVSREQVDRGLGRLRETLAEGVERKLFTAEKTEQILGRIGGAAELAAAGDCDLVIEAVFEDPAVKRGVFGELDRSCKPSTILATNTSSLYVRELAATTSRPDRFLGLHYFYHPAKNRLVEVVAGEATDAEVYAVAWRFQEIIGKTPIRSADAPGFVVNRYFVPWINEAVRILEEGEADIATIEQAAKHGFRIGMGPFQLMNVTGIPIALHAARTLGSQLGPFYEPSPRLAEQVERRQPWPLDGIADEAKARRVVDRLLGVTFFVAGQLIDDDISSIEDVDIGARVGLRWPRGPFELINRAGVDRATELAGMVADRWQLEVPAVLTRQRSRRQPFAFDFVRLEVEEGVGTVTINRPDAMNALNMEVIEQLGRRFDEAESRDDVRGIVLAGAGKAFVAGADIRFFVRNIETGDIAAICRLTEAGQEVYRRIDESPKTVVAKLDGLSLGGGSELALCADYIVASPRGSLGFPETGIGIYPGLGGTQRTRLRVGTALTQYLVMTGDVISASRAEEIGLIDAVVDPAELDATARAYALGRPPVTRRQPARTAACARERDFFERHTPESVLAGEVDPTDEVEARLVRKLRSKAPVAVARAAELIRRGEALPLAEGLALELSYLEEVFTTADALTGLRSVGRERPVFSGR